MIYNRAVWVGTLNHGSASNVTKMATFNVREILASLLYSGTKVEARLPSLVTS